MEGIFFAMPGFVGDGVIEFPDGPLDQSCFWSEISPCNIDGNNQDVNGILGYKGTFCKFKDVYIINCQRTAIENLGIQGMQVLDAYIVGCDYSDYAYPLTMPPVAWGCHSHVADNYYGNVCVANIPGGIRMDSPGKIVGANVYGGGGYAAGVRVGNPMHVGIQIKGKTFVTSATVGWVYPTDLGQPPDDTNGGVQFNLTGVDSSLVNCFSQANADKGVGSQVICPVFVSGAYNTLVNHTVDDGTSEDVMVPEYYKFDSAEIRRSTSIIGGSFLRSTLAGGAGQGSDPGGAQFAYLNSTRGISQNVKLKIGTQEIQSYNANYMKYQMIGGICFFTLVIKLLSKEGLTGDIVSIVELPEAPLDMGPIEALTFVVGTNWGVGQPAFIARVDDAAPKELVLYNATNMARLTDVDIRDTQLLTVTGAYAYWQHE